MRSVCVPLVANVTVVACESQYAPFCHPQLCRLTADVSVARFTSKPDVELNGYACAPFAIASEYCTHTESLNLLSFNAFIRSHSAYGVAA